MRTVDLTAEWAERMCTFDSVPESELAEALPLLLAPPEIPGGAPAAAVRQFRTYLADSPMTWWGLRCGPSTAPRAIVGALLLPGRTAILLLPQPHAPGIAPRLQSKIVHAALEQLAAHALHYVQALVEPHSAGRRELLVQSGFRHLTRLIYLERDATYPWVDEPDPARAEWQNFTPAAATVFTEVIQQTYEASEDCPELSGLRPMEDVLASHKASGRFVPALWEIVRVEGAAAGCLLLAELPQATALEVVYMGVVPSFRGRGVGDLLLRRALAQCRARRVRQLTLVVDARNTPARRLYARFGLQPVTERDAWLKTWS